MSRLTGDTSTATYVVNSDTTPSADLRFHLLIGELAARAAHDLIFACHSHATASWVAGSFAFPSPGLRRGVTGEDAPPTQQSLCRLGKAVQRGLGQALDGGFEVSSDLPRFVAR